MARKIISLLTATSLSVSLTSGALAATGVDNDAAAETSTVVVAVAAAQGTSTKAKPKADKGLCDRLGGVFGIAAVVNRFSDAIITNPLLNQNPALVAWNQNEAPTRLPGLKVLRTMWIADKASC